jgi:hypothetical protein
LKNKRAAAVISATKEFLVATVYFRLTADDPEMIRMLTKVRRELAENHLAESTKVIKKIGERWDQKRPWLQLERPPFRF